MKLIVTESQYKRLLKKYTDIDLTGKVKMITNYHDLPTSFKHIFPKHLVDAYLNNYGPMYTMHVKGNHFLLQPRTEGHWGIEDYWGKAYGTHEFLDYLGLTYFGITIQELIDEFLEEDFDG